MHQAAVRNRSQWTTYQGNMVSLFDNIETDERRMDMAIQNGDHNQAKQYAHEGLITESFLEFLIKYRMEHDKSIPLNEKEPHDNNIPFGVNQNKKRKSSHRH